MPGMPGLDGMDPGVAPLRRGASHKEGAVAWMKNFLAERDWVVNGKEPGEWIGPPETAKLPLKVAVYYMVTMDVYRTVDMK